MAATIAAALIAETCTSHNLWACTVVAGEWDALTEFVSLGDGAGLGQEG
jgi:hypothetical protein